MNEGKYTKYKYSKAKESKLFLHLDENMLTLIYEV